MNRFWKACIWIVICLPVAAAILDFTIGILAAGRSERGRIALMIGSGTVEWLKTPSTLMFLQQIIMKIIRTIPPPVEDCHFWCRWCYDFLQTLGENPDLKGKSKLKSFTDEADKKKDQELAPVLTK